MVHADEGKVKQVIGNIVDNAIKYTPAGGYISVSADRVAETATISVSDTGKGITETDLPHIFEKFYRAAVETEYAMQGSTGTAAPGVGLGLYLAQHIVEQLDGKISVESQQGVGTTFTVHLPLWIENVSTTEITEHADVKALVSS